MNRPHQLHEMSLLVTLVNLNFLHVVYTATTGLQYSFLSLQANIEHTESDLQPEEPKQDYQLSEENQSQPETSTKNLSVCRVSSSQRYY